MESFRNLLTGLVYFQPSSFIPLGDLIQSLLSCKRKHHRPLHGFHRHLDLGTVAARITANVWKIVKFSTLITLPLNIRFGKTVVYKKVLICESYLQNNKNNFVNNISNLHTNPFKD